MTLSVLSVLARQGSDPWREAGRLASLPKAEASDSLAHTIAAMPRSLWDLPDATVIAARLIGLLPARPGRGEKRTIAMPTAKWPSTRTMAIIACVAIGTGYLAWMTMRPAPLSFDGSDVGSFATLAAPDTRPTAPAAAAPGQDQTPGRASNSRLH